MAVKMGESNLLSVDAVHFECLGYSLISAHTRRYFTLGTLRGLEVFKDATGLFCLNLSSKLGHKFTERAKSLIFVPNQLDKLAAIGN